MRILLVYPQYPDTFWSFKHALRFISKKASNPPLGLLTVAALLPREWEQRLADLNVRPLGDNDLLWADYVLISAMTVQRASARQIIDRCRNLGVKTVAGGPLFTTCPEEFPDVNHLVLDEAEVTLGMFLADLQAGSPKPVYTSKIRADITQTPPPRWDLVDCSKYASLSLQYSRGCPFNCDFCNITMLYGHQPRTKELGLVLAELDAIYALGWRGSVFMVDDNFIGNKQKLKQEILPALIDWMARRRHPFNFYTQVSINLADDEVLMELMVRAGFDTVFVGIETPNEASLAECSKVQNKQRDLVAAVKKIQHQGLQVQGGFIVGFDSDPQSIFVNQIEFIQKSGIVTAMVGLLSALRGTGLYERLQKEKRILKEGTGNNTDGTLNFIPKMPPATLLSGYRQILATIYEPEFYYRRIREFLREYRPRPVRIRRLHLSDIEAFFGSILILGIIGKERAHYWKLLGWSLVKNPRAFPVAVQYAIYGFHFRKVLAETV